MRCYLALASFPGSHPEREREPGKIGGVKPWTSGGWVLAVPIRLQNDSHDKFATTASNVATPLRTIVQKSHYNDGIQQGISSDHRKTLLSCVWQALRAKKNPKKTKALFTVVGLRDRIAERLLHLLGLTIMKICPNLPVRGTSPTSTNLLACKHSQCDRHPR